MPIDKEKHETRIMHGIAVAVLSDDRERLTVLQTSLEGTNLGHANFTHLGFPSSPTDPMLRQLQGSRSEVVLVDIDPKNVQRAINAIELIHGTTNDISIFAAGDMTQPALIVAAMRAGAREFIDRSASREVLLECLTRHASAQSKTRSSVGKGKVFTFLNAKGGAGSTTVAVNTAIALQRSHSKVVLIDFAPIGHAALHLNVRPSFGIYDALENLHRMDRSLLEGFMTPHKGGLHLLAGPQQPHSVNPTPAELARLFDLLVTHYNFVLIDCSSRLDQTTRLLSDLSNAVLLVTHTDVVSLWSAGRIHTFLEEGTGRDRLRLILNRYKKIPGFGEEDVEKATNCKVLWKVPNNYQAIGPAIDKGTPVALHSNEDASRSFIALASALAEASTSAEGALDLVFQHDKSDVKKKSAARLLISPLRAGQ